MVALVGRVGVLERRVADLSSRVDRCLLPDGVQIACLVNGHRRKITACLDRAWRAEVGNSQIDAVQPARIADVRNWDEPKGDWEAAADRDFRKCRVVVDNVNVLYRR